jgi:hypothetical protein
MVHRTELAAGSKNILRRPAAMIDFPSTQVDTPAGEEGE